MKIIVTAEKEISIEVQQEEGQLVAFTDIVGILEFAKQMVLAQWQQKLNESKQVVENEG